MSDRDKQSISERGHRNKKANLDLAILGGFKANERRFAGQRNGNPSRQEAVVTEKLAVDLPENYSKGEWLDKLFQQFEKYSQEFNRLVEEPHLISACYPPREEAHENPLINSRQGVVSTKHWQLVTRLRDDGIAGFLLPKSVEHSFLSNPSEFKDSFFVQAVGDGESETWLFEGKAVDYYELPNLAKRFFSSLVEVARSEALESLDDDELSSDTAKASEHGQDEPDKRQSNANVEQAAFKDLLNFGHNQGIDTQNPQEMPGRGLLSLLQEPEDKAENEQISRESKSAQEFSPIGTILPETESDRKEAEMLKTDELSIASACEMMRHSIDKELDSCTKAGMRAFENQDLPAIERMMKRTKKLKDFKEQVIPVLSDWERIEHEDE